MSIVTVGIDLAKNVFAVHGVDDNGKPALVKPKVARDQLVALIAQLPPCTIGMEACSGAHHWARLFRQFGHTVRLMAPKFVSPYRMSGKRGKNDAADAAAICEAVTRPNMRFVPVKEEHQQIILCLHRTRQGFVEERTALYNRLRGLIAEFGIVLPQKITCLRRQIGEHFEDLPGYANQCVGDLLAHADVLDALGCDVATLGWDYTNAFDQPELWKPYDFGGRLDAVVRDPEMFAVEPDGTVIQPRSGSKMPPASHVFESEHGGNPILLGAETPRPDLKKIRQEYADDPLRDDEIRQIRDLCRRARESTDRAIFFEGPGANIAITNFGGMAVFPLLCYEDPDFVAELHDIILTAQVEKVRALLPEIKDYIDIYRSGGDDWGTQNQTIAPKYVYDTLFMPYYRRINDVIHEIAPEIKTFLHSCGAIYDLIDSVVESGFDILNPVQWTAGTHAFAEWKEKARNRLTLWGGGVNTQATLPLGTVEDVEREVAEIVACMKQDGGYVFCAIHNLLAEVEPEKVVALYRAAGKVQ